MTQEFPDVLSVEVTAEDIESGVPRECSRCPIARAARRAAGAAYAYVRVGLLRVGGARYVPDLPYEVEDFIDQFDNYGRSASGAVVRPRTFNFLRVLP